ncbi:MAG: DUF4406 domain-containing protein [Acidimicrobiia bacterium]|nr:DUF4406 domain-containing protein [Acidimicrobiia bacterium]
MNTKAHGHSGDQEPLARVVYVCHPLRDDPARNVESVQRICRRLLTAGSVPLAPQLLLPRFLDEATERDIAIKMCVILVGKADELWVYGDPSEGMRLEIAEARRLGVPVIPGDSEAEKSLTGDPPRR